MTKGCVVPPLPSPSAPPPFPHRKVKAYLLESFQPSEEYLAPELAFFSWRGVGIRECAKVCQSPDSPVSSWTLFPQSVQDGRTPLMIASLGGHAAICSQLLQRGARVNVTDKNDKWAFCHPIPNPNPDKLKRSHWAKCVCVCVWSLFSWEPPFFPVVVQKCPACASLFSSWWVKNVFFILYTFLFCCCWHYPSSIDDSGSRINTPGTTILIDWLSNYVLRHRICLPSKELI